MNNDEYASAVNAIVESACRKSAANAIEAARKGFVHCCLQTTDPETLQARYLEFLTELEKTVKL